MGSVALGFFFFLSCSFSFFGVKQWRRMIALAGLGVLRIGE